MPATDPPPPGGRLDGLIRRFAEHGYAAGGGEVAEAGDAGHASPGGHGHGTGHGDGSVREFDHRGHAVRIVTRYEVTVDGEPFDLPILVSQDGTVGSHGLPQYAVPSAVDLVRAVIDHSLEAPEAVRAAVRAAREEG